MNGRDDRIYEEAAALWLELFGEPPPMPTDGGALLDAITRSMPEKSYERLISPYLRPSLIVGPVLRPRA